VDTTAAKGLALMLFEMLETVERENEALRVALRLRGARRSELQAQLNELQEHRAIRRRVQAMTAPSKKQIEAIFGEIDSKETLARLPVRGASFNSIHMPIKSHLSRGGGIL
jgi:hypothetical protein